MRNRVLARRLFAAAVVIIFVGVFSIGTAGAAGKTAREVPKGNLSMTHPTRCRLVNMET
ncbi:MAG: hypothetical protein WCQ90_09140 [Deltaproteobacteria bacterium]